MTDDLVERLRDKNCCDATKCNCDEAADRIKKLYEYIGAYEDQTNIMLVRIEQLEAALRLAAGMVSTTLPFDIDHPEEVLEWIMKESAALGEKKDG